MKDFYQQHIQKLEERLSNIYTIDSPKDYPIKNNSDTINLLELIERLEKMESVYSVIEQGNHSDETYKEYNGYLVTVRKALEILHKEKELLENMNVAEIKNINLLLDSFRAHLSEIR